MCGRDVSGREWAGSEGTYEPAPAQADSLVSNQTHGNPLAEAGLDLDECHCASALKRVETHPPIIALLLTMLAVTGLRVASYESTASCGKPQGRRRTTVFASSRCTDNSGRVHSRCAAQAR